KTLRHQGGQGNVAGVAAVERRTAERPQVASMFRTRSVATASRRPSELLEQKRGLPCASPSPTSSASVVSLTITLLTLVIRCVDDGWSVGAALTAATSRAR